MQRKNIFFTIFPYEIVFYYSPQGDFMHYTQRISRVIVVIFLMNSYGMSRVFPDFHFPRPSGHYSVGRTSYHFVDKNRVDPLAKKMKHVPTKMDDYFRELMVQVWYPSDESDIIKEGDCEKRHYLPKVMPYLKKKVSEHHHIPIRILDWLLGTICARSVRERTLSSFHKTYPVLILSHGIGSISQIHAVQIEELASQGYIVVGIDHTFDCCATVFPDGRAISQYLGYKSRFTHVLDRVEMLIGDVRFVLDKLEGLNQHDPKKRLTGRLDLSRIGMFGHSMGGMTTTHVCRVDDRIKAGVNMDGPVSGKPITDGLKKPFMFMLADNTLERLYVPLSDKELSSIKINREEAKKLQESYEIGIPTVCKHSTSDVYVATIRGTAHHTFCDLPVLKKVSFFFRFFDFGIGTIDSNLSTKIINDYLLSFFDKYLKNKRSPLLDGYTCKYPEVVIIKW